MRFFTTTSTGLNRTFLVGCLLAPFFFSPCVFAETMYVSDYLVVNLKDKLEKPYTVVATVQSDEPLDILEKTDSYVKVKTATGEVGWIAKQYLKEELPKKNIIEQLQTEITSLKDKLSSLQQYEVLASNPDQTQQTILDLQAQNSSLNNELNVLSQTNSELEQEVGKLRQLKIVSDENISLLDQHEEAKTEIQSLQASIEEQQNQLHEAEQTTQQLADLKKKYEDLLFTSENSTAIAKERDALKKKSDENQLVINQLQSQIAALRNNQMMYWFLAGAAVFIVGMVFGKINVRKKKRLSLS